MGFAGKKVQTGGKKKMVGRITGLDPANPGFNYDSPVVRLDKTDAKFVDVVHTDTETILVMGTHFTCLKKRSANLTVCISYYIQHPE